ncbi:Sister chromatid cohesion protein pds5 [Blastocladiella emersonii ATCC 22665]|nr:Sister chromatid cohesion protein pds5 [Blastocladiella emersonii ATCC 22665]
MSAELRRLDFTQSLVPRERNIPASELVRRLKALNSKLCELGDSQSGTDPASCDDVKVQLVAPSVLHHRDRHVKIMASCCIGELFRIYVPDPPFSDPQLKDIFELFANQLQCIDQFDNAYHPFYLQLFSSLAITRSISLVADLENSEELTVKFFDLTLSRVSDQHPPHIHGHAAELLIALITECPSLSVEIAELLLARLREPETSIAHRIALDVVRETADRLHKYVTQYFMEVVVRAAKESIANKSSPAASAALVEATEAHSRMAELYILAPKLLLSVIPSLEEELVVEQAPFRTLATTTLGNMLAISAAVAPPLAREYPSAWRAWCGRHIDRHTPIRIQWVAHAAEVYNQHAHLDPIGNDLNACLVRVLTDQDEKVRLAACQIFGSQLDFNVLRKHASAAVWEALGSRIRDKRLSVRLQAMRSVGYLWRRVIHVVLPAKVNPKGLDAVGNGESQQAGASESQGAGAQSQIYGPGADAAGGDSQFQVLETNLDDTEITDLLTTFKWAPRELLSSMYLNDKELIAVLENVLIETVVHPKDAGAAKTMTDADWRGATERLLWFLSAIIDDDRAKCAFHAVLKLQSVTVAELGHLVSFAGRYSAQAAAQPDLAVEATLARLIQGMADRLPDAPRAQQTLNKFVKLYDGAWGDALRALTQWGDRDFHVMRRTAKDVLRKTEAAMPGSMQTLGILARRASPFIVSHEMVPKLLDRVVTQDPTGWTVRLCLAAQWLLDSLATLFPATIQRHVPELLALLNNHAPRVLQLLAHVECREIPAHDVATLTRLARTQPALAAAAGSVLARGNHVAACKELLANAEAVLKDTAASADAAWGALTYLAELAKYQVDLYEVRSADLTQRAIRRLVENTYSVDDARDWLDTAELPAETRAQLAALTLLINRVASLAARRTTLAHAMDASQPLARLLAQILERRGQLHDDLPAFAASALRQHAGLAILELAGIPALRDRVPTLLYLRLAQLLEDPLQPVRTAVLHALRALLIGTQTSPRFVPLLALVANDPDEATKTSAASLIKALASRSDTGDSVEQSLARLLHTVAFLAPPGKLAGDLKLYTPYVELFLGAVLRAESAAVLYHILMKIKEHQVRRGLILKHDDDEDEDAAAAAAAVPAGEDGADGADDNVVRAPPRTADEISALVDENLYTLAEWTVKYLRDKCKLHGWPIATVAATVDLPRELFTPLKGEAAERNVKRVYLPAAAAVPTGAAPLSTAAAAAKKRPASGGEGSTPAAKRAKKAAAATAAGTPKKKKKRAAKAADDGGEQPDTPPRRSARARARPAKGYRDSSDDEDGGEERHSDAAAEEEEARPRETSDVEMSEADEEADGEGAE